jgi:hypothetical protein
MLDACAQIFLGLPPFYSSLHWLMRSPLLNNLMFET